MEGEGGVEIEMVKTTRSICNWRKLWSVYFLFLRSSELIRPRRGWSRRKCCGLSRDAWRPWNGNFGSIKKLCTHRLRSLFVNWSGRSTVSRTSWSTTTNSVGWVSFTLPLICTHSANRIKLLIKNFHFSKFNDKSCKKEEWGKGAIFVEYI